MKKKKTTRKVNLAVYQPCPWCQRLPAVDTDMANRVYCDTDGCPIKGIMMTAVEWDGRK